MARQRSPNRDKAFEVFKEHDGNITNRKIAEILNEDEKIVAVWKQRDKWNVVQQSDESCTTNKSKIGAPKGNQNAIGNPGNKNPKWGNKNAVGHGPPKGNDNATTHGLFKKIIPNDDPYAMELIEEIQNHTGLDMLFHSIQLQYFNILNSQRIMHVRDKDDMSKEVISESEGGEAYMVQFAWDKQANLLTAYARAMNTLTSMIEKFNKLADVDDERRTKLSLMEAQIDKLKADTNKEDKDVLRVQIIDDVPQDDDDV
ncbi:phage terminase small subunit [Bacillus paranthracis]|uniref:Phage terminase small subunit n=1 Tax=Bacillus paranthracis TaxID=2026186 RepID=A0AAX3QLA0_9BACI|nr:phage terminase small subunit [Bacillus paranthracis]WES09716.1 phage terminase small subunit [Bacillus paranthracis]HDR4446681.1 terminase [Bacillus cereus]